MFEVSESYIKWFIQEGLKEDVGSGDHTSNACINPDSRSNAALIVKDHGLIAGVELARMIFHEVDPRADFTTYFSDGKPVIYGDIAFEVNCNTRSLFMVERLILNTMQRMSGIASMSSRFAFEVNDLPVKILDTRKTTPLLRPLEKWAVKIGGCHNYRSGLYDWIMIKDNHIDASGGIAEAIESVHQYMIANKLDLGITIEVRNLVELHEVLSTGGVTRIMLDNFEVPLLKEAVETIDGRYETEASGGIHLENVRRIALTGVDYISTGAVTHSAGILDLSLKIV